MQVANQEHINVEMALALNKYVHDHCKDVPHDIGLHLAEIVNKYIPAEAIPREEVEAMLRTSSIDAILESCGAGCIDCGSDVTDEVCIKRRIAYAMSHPTGAGEDGSDGK